jgi:hypothetical protein
MIKVSDELTEAELLSLGQLSWKALEIDREDAHGGDQTDD